MLVPILIGCTLIFCAWLAFERSKHTRAERKLSQQFWEREQQANHTRNKDMSGLEYFHVDPSTIPSNTYNSQLINQAKEQLFADLGKKMLDLSDYSNTDLKLAYGVGNFTILTTYDNNYTTFFLHLSHLGRAYQDEKHWDEAVQCYLLCLSLGSKKVSDYTSLGQIYISSDQPEKVSELIQTVTESSLKHKTAILNHLRQILASYQ